MTDGSAVSITVNQESGSGDKNAKPGATTQKDIPKSKKIEYRIFCCAVFVSACVALNKLYLKMELVGLGIDFVVTTVSFASSMFTIYLFYTNRNTTANGEKSTEPATAATPAKTASPESRSDANGGQSAGGNESANASSGVGGDYRTKLVHDSDPGRGPSK